MRTGGAAGFFGIRDTIGRPDAYEERHPDSTWPTARFDESTARGYVQLRPPEIDGSQAIPVETIAAFADAMWEQATKAGPLDADVFDILTEHTIRSAGLPFALKIEDVLVRRGLKPKKSGSGRRGGYEPEQLLEHYEALQRIANTTVTVKLDPPNLKGKHQNPEGLEYRGRPYAMTDELIQPRFDGRVIGLRMYVTPGLAQALSILGPVGQQIAWLDTKALQFNPHNQRHEKALCRYLSWIWKTRARTRRYDAPLRVKTLLERAGFELNEARPGRTLNRLKQALDTLRDEDVIASWGYESWSLGDAPARGWAPGWLEANVVITPPPAIRDAYSGLYNPDPPKPLSPDTAFEERLRVTRLRLDLSQQEAAQAARISQQAYSRAERGRGVSAQNRRKLEVWLATHSPSEQSE